jgi:hypothetical protein
LVAEYFHIVARALILLAKIGIHECAMAMRTERVSSITAVPGEDFNSRTSHGMARLGHPQAA